MIAPASRKRATAGQSSVAAGRERSTVEPAQVTVLGHRMADGEMSLFRRINLPEPIDRNNAEAAGRGRRRRRQETIR